MLVEHYADNVEGLRVLFVKLISFSVSHPLVGLLRERPLTCADAEGQELERRRLDEEESRLDVAHDTCERVLATNEDLLQRIYLLLFLVALPHIICVEANLPSDASLANRILVLDLAYSLLDGLLCLVLLKLFLFGRVKSRTNLLQLLKEEPLQR